MNVEKVHDLLARSCVQLRKGEPVTVRQVGAVRVTDVYDMPHRDEAGDLIQVDVHFMVVGVRQWTLDEVRAPLLAELAAWPDPARLAGGPSYIEAGAVLGDQSAALMLFALGEALGIWQVVTPKTLGVEGPAADEMAGRGLVMCTGWRPE